MIRANLYKNRIEYSALLVLLSAVTLWLVFLGLGSVSIGLPLADTYTNTDGRMTIAFFKSVLEGHVGLSGIMTSDKLAAPFSFSTADFPTPMFAVVLYIYFLSIFSHDPIVVFNLFILSTFYLNAVVMYAVARKLSIGVIVSIAVALMFTFLPFHYFRFGHTFYIGYFFIPFWVYIALKLLEEVPLFFSSKSENSNGVFTSWKFWLVVLLIISSTWNFYYTFFFDFLLFFILIAYVIGKKSLSHYKSLLLVFVAVTLPFVINMVPYKLHAYEQGENLQVAQRNPIESELYGLKIAQLVLPVTNHRVDSWAKLKGFYNSQSLLFNESQDSTLGLMGSIGFLILILAILFKQISNRTLYALSQFNLVSVLLATVGGFSVVFAFLVTPEIRAYNRISVFIATFSFLALAIVVQNYLSRRRISHVKVIVGVILITVLSLLDESPRNTILATTKTAYDEFQSDKIFTGELEQRLKKNAMIAQFPYMPYPENGPIVKMADYEPIWGYIHGSQLKWSYGAVRGRESDFWWKNVIALPLEKQVGTLQKAGFSGIVIDRRGYKDQAKGMITELSKLLKTEPSLSKNTNLVFFKLTPTGHSVNLPITFLGFYPWEGPEGSFRWAGVGSQMKFYCHEKAGCKKYISFDAGTLVPRNILFRLNGRVINQVNISSGEKHISLELNLKQGKNILRMTSDTNPVNPPGPDERGLVFSMKNLVIK